jgi:hypothetical protein
MTELRERLFAMTLSGEPLRAVAEYALDVVEKQRNEFGRISDEPRYPDLASGRPWPPAASC